VKEECKDSEARTSCESQQIEHQQIVGAPALLLRFNSARSPGSAGKQGTPAIRMVPASRVNMHDEFYGDAKILATTLARLNRAPISERNRQTISDFTTALQAEGVGRFRVTKYLYHLTEIARILGIDFAEAQRTDIVRLMAAIEGRPYSPYTKSDYKAVCKRFYKWLRATEEYPPEVRWIRANMRGAARKLPEEMLTEEEIAQLMRTADNARDRAIVMVLYESGCRIGEVGQLRIRNVEFDDFGARLIVNGKTGMRRVRVVGAAVPLATWLSLHPLRTNPESPLWVGLGTSSKNRVLTRSAIAQMIERLAARSGIKKRVYPHLFRHSRATALASKLTEAQLKEMFGWTQSSSRPATYVHLSGRNVDEAILRTYGIRTGDSSDDVSSLKPTSCTRCGTTNAFDARLCQRCGLPSSQEAALAAEDERTDWDGRLTSFEDHLRSTYSRL